MARVTKTTQKLSPILWSACVCALLLTPGLASGTETDAPPKYKKYTPPENSTQLTRLLEITSYGDSAQFTVFDTRTDSADVSVWLATTQIGSKDAQVNFGDNRVQVLDRFVDLALTVDVTDTIFDDPDYRVLDVYRVTLWTSPDAARLTRLAPRERITTGEDYTVPAQTFIHSSVVVFGGNITVRGEINRSAVAVGGDVLVADGAVIRDHAVSIGGDARLEPEARVYGFALPAVNGERPRRRRRPWIVHQQDLSFLPSFTYNRVDGFTPRVAWRFTDADTTLPEMKITFGIGTSSERTRVRFDIRQPLSKRVGLYAYGAGYKDTRTDDEYLLDPWKNTLTSLTARKDYYNHYESEGGEIGALYKPPNGLELSVGVYNEQLTPLPASRRLWSLMGGEEYPENYQGLDPSQLAIVNSELNETRIAAIVLQGAIENRRSFDEPRTRWRVTSALERAFDGFDSDFNFTRFTIEAAVSQRITRYSNFDLRIRTGAGSDGLPLHRHFFVGGYRWLRGYEHMEFLGDQYTAAAADYGIDLSGVGLNSLRFWLFYDLGGISLMNSPTAYYHSLGLALSLDESLRLNVARRLDRSDPGLRVTVEF